MAKANVYDVLMRVAEKVNKKHDFQIAVPGKEQVGSDVRERVLTDSVMLNLLFGGFDIEGQFHEGVPVGKIIEIFGDYSHGKSTILQIIMNAFQQVGVSALIDSESAWDRVRALVMGHRVEKHLALEADTLELGFKVMHDTIEYFGEEFRGAIPFMIGWDTIAAAPTEGEKKDDEYESGMMYKPRKIRQELRKLTLKFAASRCTGVFLNQTIQSKDSKEKYTGIKSTGGGGGLKFHSSQRLQVTRVASFREWGASKKHSKPIGIISAAKLVKNKLGAPMQEVDIPINYKQGVDPIREVVNYLLDFSEVYNIAGAYKKIVGFDDETLSFYEKDLPEVFDKNEGLLEYLQDSARIEWISNL